jgi:hypothetical protein
MFTLCRYQLVCGRRFWANHYRREQLLAGRARLLLATLPNVHFGLKRSYRRERRHPCLQACEASYCTLTKPSLNRENHLQICPTLTIPDAIPVDTFPMLTAKGLFNLSLSDFTTLCRHRYLKSGKKSEKARLTKLRNGCLEKEPSVIWTWVTASAG